MPNDTTPHVRPMIIWQRACGGPDFSKREHRHLSTCADCEVLADEIKAAFNDIEKTLASRPQSLFLSATV